MTYNLQIYKLPKNNNLNIFLNSKKYLLTSPIENYPLFNLGYHHFINRTRQTLMIKEKSVESKNNIHYVVNPFEPNISNYEDNLNNLTKIYIKKEIQNRNFFKYWEIYYIFDIFHKDSLNILYLDTPDNDETLDSFRNKIMNKKDKEIKLASKEKADLIISNSPVNDENQFVKELLDIINKVTTKQNKNGNLILKINDTFTMSTLKLLYLLSLLYNESYIYKPFFSRPSDTEKYIILVGYLDKDISKIDFDSIIKKSKDKNISDLFIDIKINQNFIDIFKFINIRLVNQQQIIINDIIKYINNNNYYGDKYHEYTNQQIEASQWWMKTFFPPSNNIYKTNKENINKNINSTVDKNNLEKDNFINNIV